MINSQLDKSQYMDFVLSDNPRPYTRNVDDSLLFKIDVTQSLESISGATQNGDVILENIELTGYDNGLIYPPPVYTVTDGSHFTLHPVTGYTQHTNYQILTGTTFNQLVGGFYQGFFKLFGYPVEYFSNRMRKGWTVNMMLHYPPSSTTGTQLNTLYPDNSGFIYYIGTSADNKYETMTPTMVDWLENQLNFTFTNSPSTWNTFRDANIGIGAVMITDPFYKEGFDVASGMTYYGRSLALSGDTYSGYFNVTSGITYSGRTYSPGSPVLTYDEKYKDIIGNAFGIRITPDGRIGYRTIYATDICYTGATQDISGITNTSFIDYTNTCQPYSLGKIITKYFTVEESYTKTAVIDSGDTKNVLISAIFERDFAYDSTCQLEYSAYRNGTLTISINGIVVFRNPNVTEVIPHELDTDKRLQEGVPFNLSFGGGTQGLHDAVYIDQNSSAKSILEKFFAGTFYGGVRSIEMYSVPLYITEIRSLIKNNLTSYNLYYPQGGRRVQLKHIL